jgi:hypothetical protein
MQPKSRRPSSCSAASEGERFFPMVAVFHVFFKSQKSRQDGLRRCRALAIDGLHRRARAMEAAYACNLLLCISHKVRPNLLLGFEQGVDGLHRHNDLIVELEDQGRVLAVEEHDVNLIAELAVAVDDCRFRRGVALRQVLCEKASPNRLAAIAFGRRMRRCLTFKSCSTPSCRTCMSLGSDHLTLGLIARCPPNSRLPSQPRRLR